MQTHRIRKDRTETMTTATATPPRTRRIEGVVPERTVLGINIAVIVAIVLTGFAVAYLERFTLVAISAVLLVAFTLTREFGYAIPAGITGGLARMVCLVTSASIDPTSVPAVVFLSMAGGFALIWALGLAALPRTIHPGPLVPATIPGLPGVGSPTR